MANFIKNFKNQNYNDGFLPQSVLEELSKKWNGNLEYVYKENGTYMLEATNGKVELGFKNFEIENLDEIKDKCQKEKLTIEDLIDYSYNSQRPLTLKPLKNFQQFINNEKIDNNEFIISKDIIADPIPEKLVIFPEKMNKSIELKIGNGEKSYVYTFIQKPIDSLTKKRFVTSPDSKLLINYEIDNERIKFNIEINKLQNTTIKEYLETLTFMQSLFNNGMYINDTYIKGSKGKDEKYEKREKLIDLWNKVYQIEKTLGLSFTITNDLLDKNDLDNILLLYKSFIENKALRINKKINTLSFSYENIPEWFIKDLKEKKERNLCLEYSEKYNFNLLGEKIDVLKLKSYFNLFIDEIENSEETKKIHLILKENDENKTYESVQLFKNEHDLEKFFSKKDHLTELQNAEYSIPIYY